jgi:hypothetical protein
VTPLLAFLLGVWVALIVTTVAPSPWRGFLFVFGLVAATVFVFAQPPAGSWKRLGADLAVLTLTVAWVVGFAGMALARWSRQAAADRQSSDP